MDFAPVELNDHQKRERDEVVAVLDELVDEQLHARQRSSGDTSSDNTFVRGLATHGLAQPTWRVEDGGRGFDAVLARVFENELDRRRAPRDVNYLVWKGVERFGQPELVEEMRTKLAQGQARFCLGYTEPDGGSDIAGAKLRAVQDGTSWVVNGSKMFTTGAEASNYVFLLTRTDPSAAKHKGLTMFLAPLDAPGIEIQAIWTFGGERTNAVYFSDVRVDDRYRIGDVNDGWSVLRVPLDAEHDFGQDGDGLKEPFGMWVVRRSPLEHAIDDAFRWAKEEVLDDGSHPVDDPAVRARLGRIATDVELALCSEGPLGRIAGSEALIRCAAELVDLVGPRALLPQGVDGAVGGGDIELSHRFAQGAATYGGTVEVFRQMIAQYELGLPRPHMPAAK